MHLGRNHGLGAKFTRLFHHSPNITMILLLVLISLPCIPCMIYFGYFSFGNLQRKNLFQWSPHDSEYTGS
uniref:Uncharacterized protein n=1 Tax=Manihot esculenta TaxID=3983 RepID=A0A2C9VKT6_MANES